MGAQQVDEEAVFDVARQIDSPKLRGDYLQQVCGDNTAMLARVEALLKVHDNQPEFLEGVPSSVLRTVGSSSPTERKGTVIGPYKLREQIGEGGFGVVYVAQQVRPVRRTVALKIIKPGMDTKDVVARFEAERQALALMDHPNVARVLDAGATEDGRPFFVMELVHGVPITEFCDKNNLPTRQRLQLFIDICHAVHHAHQKGIIHRDLKPNNIMVTLHDGKPVPKVIDFGVSKALSQQLTQKTVYTSYGQMIGTPVYMSPEQAEMSGLGIDTRSDVYSLGVLLYELLTGKTPLDSKRLLASGYAEMLRIIREDEPPRPSTKISTLGEAATVIAQHRRTDARKLRQSLRGELDWIVMKALEKDRDRRYDTANNFAADINRYLSGDAVQACPPSTTYLLRKFVGRHRGPVIAASALMLVLCLGLAGTSFGLIWANREAHRARLAEADASRERDTANAAQLAESQARNAAEDAANRAKQAEQIARDEAENRRLQLYVSDVNRAQAAYNAGDIGVALYLLRRHQPEPGERDLRRFEWFYLWRVCHQGLSAPPLYHSDGIAGPGGVAFSPDGHMIVTGCSDGAVRLWDTDTGKEKRNWAFQDPGPWIQTISVRFSPDGATVAALGSTYGAADPGRSIVYDVRTGHQRQLGGQHLAADFVDESTLLTAGEDGILRWWNVHTGEQENVRSLDLAGATWTRVAFSPGCKTIAAKHSNEPVVSLWDLTSERALRQLKLELEQARTSQLTFSPDGCILGEMSAEGGDSYRWDAIHRLNLWDVESQELLHTIREPVRGLRSMAFLPNGVVATGGVGDIRFWNVANGKVNQTETITAHTGVVFCLSTSADRRVMASAGYDGYVKLWHVRREPNPQVVAAHEQPVDKLAYSPTGDYLASFGGEVSLWNPKTGVLVDTLYKFPGRDVGTVAFSPDGAILAAASRSDPTIRLWNVHTREPLAAIEDSHGSRSIAFSPDGQLIASGSHGTGTVKIWDVQTGRQREELQTDSEPHVAFSPVANLLAFNDGRGVIKLRNLESGDELSLGELNYSISILRFSRDGQRLASASGRYDMILWDTHTGRRALTITQKGVWGLTSIDFSPVDGSLLTAGWSGAVKLWDEATGEQRFTLRDYGGPIARSAVFSPDGRTVAAGFVDGTVVFWRADRLEAQHRTN